MVDVRPAHEADKARPAIAARQWPAADSRFSALREAESLLASRQATISATRSEVGPTVSSTCWQALVGVAWPRVHFRMDLKFEWDPRKARTNRQKHGVAFDEAGRTHSPHQRPSGDAARAADL